jgi:hypothetical protein
MVNKIDGEWDYPIEKEKVINRCRNEQTYENRFKKKSRPEDIISK